MNNHQECQGVHSRILGHLGNVAKIYGKDAKDANISGYGHLGQEGQ